MSPTSPSSPAIPTATSYAAPRPGTYVAVTGAGGSVAPYLAAALLERGWQVALLARPGKEQSALRKLADLAPAGAGDAVAAFGADLDDEHSVRMAVASAQERFGQAEALFNLAGGFAARPATESGLPDVDEMLAKNFRSAVVATKAMLPSMRGRGRGFVLAVGAGAARQAAPGRTAYAAAKAALAAYFRSLSAELRGSGIGAAILHPMGTIDTPPNRQAMPDADHSQWIAVSAMVGSALYLMGAPGGRVPELELYPA